VVDKECKYTDMHITSVYAGSLSYCTKLSLLGFAIMHDRFDNSIKFI
jgi:hypothetical protein